MPSFFLHSFHYLVVRLMYESGAGRQVDGQMKTRISQDRATHGQVDKQSERAEERRKIR